MHTITCEIHGIPEETLCEYLTRLGGKILPGGNIAGEGWAARLTRLPDYQIGHSSFCCYQVEMSGKPEIIKTIWSRFELRFMRFGG